MPLRGGAAAKLGRILTSVESTRLPMHVCAVTRQMIEQYADAVEPTRAQMIRGLPDPARSAALLDQANGALSLFDAALHDTVNPTVIRAGERHDAIPDSIELCLDGRVLPDHTPEDLAAELAGVAGADLDLEFTHVDEPATTDADTSLLPSLGAALQAVDPGARVIPMLNPGVTDGRFFAKLGIQHHGFLPMALPDPAPIIQTMHGIDERVPVSALEFGSSVYESLLLAARPA